MLLVVWCGVWYTDAGCGVWYTDAGCGVWYTEAGCGVWHTEAGCHSTAGGRAHVLLLGGTACCVALYWPILAGTIHIMSLSSPREVF